MKDTKAMQSNKARDTKRTIAMKTVKKKQIGDQKAMKSMKKANKEPLLQIPCPDPVPLPSVIHEIERAIELRRGWIYVEMAHEHAMSWPQSEPPSYLTPREWRTLVRFYQV